MHFLTDMYMYIYIIYTRQQLHRGTGFLVRKAENNVVQHARLHRSRRTKGLYLGLDVGIQKYFDKLLNVYRFK